MFEFEPIPTQMAQKPLLRVELGAHAVRKRSERDVLPHTHTTPPRSNVLRTARTPGSTHGNGFCITWALVLLVRVFFGLRMVPDEEALCCLLRIGLLLFLNRKTEKPSSHRQL